MAVIGAVRIRAQATNGAGFAVGDDSVVEVQQPDGSWMRLRGVCSAVIHVRPRDLVRATLDVEVAEIDLTCAEVSE